MGLIVLLVLAVFMALSACAVKPEAATPTPVIVGSGGDTALDRAMTTQVAKEIEKTNGLTVVAEATEAAIYVRFTRNVRVVGNGPDQRAEYQVDYRRAGNALGQRAGSCSMDDLHDCARQIVEDVLNYPKVR